MLEVLKIKVIQEVVNGVTVYTGWVEGKKVRDVAKIVHITREGEYIHGYQRSELPKHIDSITDYVESKNSTILANLVIGFNNTVTFEPIMPGSEFGYLHVPYDPEKPSSELPGAIVDGQQRSGGVKNSHHDSYPLPVSIFISENENDYIQQFLILNLGKPLTSVQLNALALYDDIYKPPALAEKAFPLSMCEELGFRNQDSPLFGLIKSNGNKEGIIAESSITEFVMNVKRQVLSILGVRVYQELDEQSRKEFVQILINFWKAVTIVFAEDWAKRSRDMKRSYITHGTSVIGFSYLCRHMLRTFQTPSKNVGNDSILSHEIPSASFFIKELSLIRDQCNFSKGYWILGLAHNPDVKDLPYSRRWNDFQNTTSEKQLFATNILRLYEIQKGWRNDYPIYID
ncbi:DGQHR domain-containing protein [Vibrio parahaemolyticus]|nr:DGQHR domain-containing protein [Vibrio parahaemolyticus]EJC6828426.1 DGQHR domain-containing protein [Vibrio parahaemolyticus]MBM5002106.1 DGQHR domain-containing protein [Vibrio parahaemolyticus]MDF4873592.1 DGQHR domain-containing protein [Vibrio parahaemolyticus]HCG8583613.1 DGQHR domain-containing protein [Vibrio parahaemolyticus]